MRTLKILIYLSIIIYHLSFCYADTAMINSFSKGILTPKLDARSDIRDYFSGCRELSNMYTNPQGGATKRPGTYYIDNDYSIEWVDDIPETISEATYNLTYISENGAIWGIPVGDGEMNSLDVGSEARNVGGGIVGLPWTGHPFTIGETIRITGTTNYNGAYTILAGTSVNEIQIADSYIAETFDGTEIIVKYIGGLNSSSGHMVKDSSGNLYYAHRKSTTGGTHYITKIETDGTIVKDYDWLNYTWEADMAGGSRGLAITPDDKYLYVWIEGLYNLGYMHKFDLTPITGGLVWRIPVSGWGTLGTGYDASIDSDGNVYASKSHNIRKWASSDGAITDLTLMGEGKEDWVGFGNSYVSLVDDDIGIIIGAGRQSATKGHDESILYNFSVRTFDDSKGAQIAIGGTFIAGDVLDSTYLIGTGMVTTHDGYIYVLSHTPTCTLYKIQWDEDDETLTIVESGDGPVVGQGIYFDLYDNLVVVNQDWSSHYDDVLYFYDTKLNYLSKIENMYTLMFMNWAAAVGGSWAQGDVVFDGVLETTVPAVPGYWVEEGFNLDADPCRLIDFVPKTEEAYVIVLGDESMAFFKGD